MSDRGTPLRRIVGELQRRKVLRVALVYGAVAWVLIQVAATVFPLLALPSWTVTLVVALLGVGFPVALVLAWALELTPDGVRRTAPAEPAPVTDGAAMRVRRKGPPGWVWGLAGALLLLAGALVAYARLRAPEPLPPPTAAATATATGDASLAVLPFRVRGTPGVSVDEDVVDLLSLNLERVEGLHVIRPAAVLKAWRSEPLAADDDAYVGTAVEVARGLGARYAVTGMVLRRESSIRLIAEVWDVLRDERRGTVQRDGPADSLFALMDGLTLDLLTAGLVQHDDPYAPRGALRPTSESLPALQAYLAGERKFRESRFLEAFHDYTRAVELDSTFAQATYRAAMAAGWANLDDAAAVYGERAARLADRLPERDALLLGGLFEADRIVRLEALTRRYPDDAEGWYALGDAYFHDGGRMLHPPSSFRNALERAVELSPYYGHSYLHLIEDGFARLDSAGTRRYVERYTMGGVGSDFGYTRLTFDLMWGDGAARARADRRLDGLSTDAIVRAPLATSPGTLDRLEEVLRRRLESGTSIETRGPALYRILLLRGSVGQIEAARKALQDAEAFPELRHLAARWTLMFHLSGFPDSASASRAARILEQDADPLDHFWLGVLAAAEGRWADATRAAAASDELASALRTSVADTSPATADPVGAAVRAYVRLRRGEPGADIALSDAMRALPGYSWVSEQPFLRHELGRDLLARGDDAGARRYFESFYHYDHVYSTLALLQLGRIHDRHGEHQAARHYYVRFREFWGDSDQAFRSWSAEADAALTRLEPGAD